MKSKKLLPLLQSYKRKAAPSTSGSVNFGADLYIAGGLRLTHLGGNTPFIVDNTQATGTNSVTLNRPALWQAGDLLLAVFGQDADLSIVIDLVPPVSGGWVFLGYVRNTYGACQAWYKITGSSEPSTYTFTISSSGGSGTGGGGIGPGLDGDPSPGPSSSRGIAALLIDIRNGLAPEGYTGTTSSASPLVASGYTTGGPQRLIITAYGGEIQDSIVPQSPMGLVDSTVAATIYRITAGVDTVATAGTTGNRTGTTTGVHRVSAGDMVISVPGTYSAGTTKAEDWTKLYEFGIIDYSTNSKNLYTYGHMPINTNIPLVTLGHSPINTNVPLYVFGQQINRYILDTTLYITGTGYPFNSNINLYVPGSVPFDNNINLYINAFGNSFTDVPLSIYGANTATQIGGIDLYLRGIIGTDFILPLSITGYHEWALNTTLFTEGGYAATYSNIPLYIDGAVIAGMNLFLKGYDIPISSSVLPLLVYGSTYNGLIKDVPLYIRAALTGNLNLVLWSDDSANRQKLLNLFVQGSNLSVANSLPIYLENFGLTTDISLFTQGEGTLAGGQPIGTAMNLFIRRGIGDMTPLFIAGPGLPFIGSTNLYIKGVVNINGTINLVIADARGVPVKIVPLFTSGF
jgi:hypothetical protein